MNDNESELFQEVLVLFKVGYWETWRKEHVDQDNLESSYAEYGVVKKCCFAVQMNTLVKGVPSLGKLRFVQSVLIFYQEEDYKEWPDENSTDY